MFFDLRACNFPYDYKRIPLIGQCDSEFEVESDIVIMLPVRRVRCPRQPYCIRVDRLCDSLYLVGLTQACDSDERPVRGDQRYLCGRSAGYYVVLAPREGPVFSYNSSGTKFHRVGTVDTPPRGAASQTSPRTLLHGVCGRTQRKR